MKRLVFVLVLVNLLFFAYSEGYLGRSDNPDAIRLQKQMNPTQLQVVSRGEPPTVKDGEKKTETPGGNASTLEKPADAGKENAKAAPITDVCLAWGGLSAPDADRLAVLLTEKFEDFKLNRQSLAADVNAWWVFIPPLSSKVETERKTVELKKLGIEDFQVIQDSGPNRWAISLGIFSNENSAKARLAMLKEKGVKSAKQAPRMNKETTFSIEARGPATRQQAILETITANASIKLQAKACQ